MRKVMFKEWIPVGYEQNNTTYKTVKVGTNCWSKDYLGQGLFHQWASSYEEFENGAGNYTVALVELEDGTIKEVLPSNIKFIQNEE